MSDTVDIGAARIRLIVDAADFQPVIDQGKSAIIGFGQTAQQAYDRTEKGTRRAADALLDYVNSLGRADTTMDKFIRNASRMGVEKPVLDAAITAWAKYTDEVEQAAAAQADSDEARKRAQSGLKELMTTQAAAETQARSLANAQAATRIQNLSDSHANQSQQDINALVAPGLGINTETIARREAAEQIFAEIVARENLALEQQAQLTLTIAQARQQSNTANAQQDFNRLLGIPQEQEALALIQRRRDATAAFLPVLEEESRLEQQAAAVASKQQAFVQQLENTAATAGKSYYEMLQLRAAELGLGEAYQPLIAKIRQQNEAMGAGTLSAKQYEFALRGLPAQFTDIVVSLQGGQAPLTVLLQQGGQIKDMFGGVGNAVKVVAQRVAALATNPWVLLAGVIAAVGVAAFEAQSRITELSIATAKGNQVAGSAKGLSGLADQLSKLNNISIGNADKAVSSLAAAGKLTGENFTEAAQASARWATITGQSVDDIAGKFNELAADPMAAVLNGTLRVTAAQYEQLEALDRTGHKVEEVALAIKLYQDQVNDNSDSVLRNLSEAEKGWIALKDAITGALHAFGEFVTQAAGSAFNKLRAPSVRDLASAGTGGEGMIDLLNQSDSLDQQLNSASGQTTRSGFGGVGKDAATQSAIAQTTRLTLDQIAANKENQKSFDELGTKQQRFNTQLALLKGTLSRSNDEFLKANGVVKALDGTLSGPGFQKLVNGLRLKIFGENQGGDPTKPIKEWEKTSLDALKNVQLAQDYLYQAGATSTETYYAVSEGLVRADESIQLQSIEKQKAALKGRANSESQIAALTQQALTVRQTTATSLAKLDHDEVLAVQAKINAYHDYVQTLADANIQLARQGQQASQGVGMGDRQAALLNAISNAQQAASLRERAAQDRVDALGAGDHAEAQVQANKEIEASQAALSTQISILNGNYQGLRTAEASYLDGSKKAWENWRDSVTNNAAEAGKVFGIVMNDITDSIVDAATKGHLSFKNLLADLLREIVEYGAKQALLFAALGLGVGGGKSGVGGGGGGALGAIGGGGGGAAGLVGNIGGLAALLGSTGATSAAASGLEGLFSLFSGSFGGGFFAQGGAFAGGSGLASHRNSVVTSPTYFPFAKGGVPNVGLMGEKSGSPGEAIMPLTRTAGGDLGVKVTGQQPQRTFNNTQVFVVPGAVDRQTQSQLAIKQGAAANRASRRA